MPDTCVPITYREPNPALGYEKDGSPKEDTIRVCHVRVVERWETTIDAASEEDILAEGYSDREDYEADWGFLPQDTPVWVVRFELDPRDYPRLLSSGIIAGRQGPYVEHTARALPDEPEAVDEFTQSWITAEAGSRDREHIREARSIRADLPIEDQIMALAAEARARYVDVRDEMRVIDRYPHRKAEMVARMRDKLEHLLVVG